MKHLFPVGITFFITLSFSTFFQPISASDELFATDARAMALGGVQALSHELYNPAYLSFQTQNQVGVSVNERFQMEELNTFGCYALVPNSLLDAGVKLSTYGYEDYRLLGLQAGLAKKINSKMSLGINLFYRGETSIWEEKNRNELAAGLGFFMNLNENIDIALFAENLLASSSMQPFMMHAGMDYQAFSNCHLLLEMSADGEKYFNASIGLEYELIEKFIIRGGMRTQPKNPSFGVAYSWRSMNFDAGFSLHHTLGMSSIFKISYLFGNRTEK